MKVLVCGSRGWSDRTQIRENLEKLPKDSTIITGGARGVDTWASWECNELELFLEVYLPDWKKHGKAAGPIRNSKMLEQKPDEVWAFWDGKSRGTQDTIRKATNLGIPIKIFSENKS